MFCDSDEDLFITQSTFRNESETGVHDETDDNDWLFQDFGELLESNKHESTWIETVLPVILPTPIPLPRIGHVPPVVTSNVSHASRLNIKSDSEIQKMALDRIPKNTLYKNNWAVNTFTFWQNERNKLALNSSLNISAIHPELEEMTKDELNYALSRFVSEMKKKDGNDYPGQTLYELVMAIQNHLSVKGKCYRFLNDPSFKQLQDSLDCIMKTRCAAGIGIQKRQAQVLSFADEDKFWS